MSVDRETLFEVYAQQYANYLMVEFPTRNVRQAIRSLHYRRRRIRVRTFFDRHTKRRIVRFLCGSD